MPRTTPPRTFHQLHDSYASVTVIGSLTGAKSPSKITSAAKNGQTPASLVIVILVKVNLPLRCSTVLVFPASGIATCRPSESASIRHLFSPPGAGYSTRNWVLSIWFRMPVILGRVPSMDLYLTFHGVFRTLAAPLLHLRIMAVTLPTVRPSLLALLSWVSVVSKPTSQITTIPPKLDPNEISLPSSLISLLLDVSDLNAAAVPPIKANRNAAAKAASSSFLAILINDAFLIGWLGRCYDAWQSAPFHASSSRNRTGTSLSGRRGRSDGAAMMVVLVRRAGADGCAGAPR